MKSKADALKEEARLLDRFDYAWNKGSNGARRHHDVLSKLEKISSRNVRLPKFVSKFLHASQMPVGIKIKGTKLLSLEQKFNNYADDKSNNFFPQVFKFSRSQPKLVLDRQGAEDGQGTSQSVKGRVRCEEHKGLKVHGNFSRSDEKNSTPVYGEDSKSSTFDGREFGSSTCGAKMPSGSYCTRPVKGNTSCWQHSAQISHRDSITSSCSDWKYGVTSFCGAPTQNGSRCRRQVKGGGGCWQHPVHAQVDGGPAVLPSPFASDRNSSNSSRNDSTTSSCSDWKYGVTSLCGAPTQNGSRCRRQVNGGGRCWQHPVHTQVDGGLGLLSSLYAPDRSSSNSSRNDWKYEGTSLCGARTRNNSSCRRQVKGGGRCWQHT